MYSEILTAEMRHQDFQAEAAHWQFIHQATRGQSATASGRASPIATMRQFAGEVLIGVGERLLPQTDQAPAALPTAR